MSYVVVRFANSVAPTAALLACLYLAPMGHTDAFGRLFVLFVFRQILQYSGGQATEGQGGYYGSGGARVISSSDVDSDGRQALLAMAADVEKLKATMEELDKLESELYDEGDDVTNKSIELKASIKKLMTSSDVTEALDRLEVQGSPVWGLSAAEREMIIAAKQKMNEC